MPTKKNLRLTRSQRKEKIQELENNAPIKRARLSVMKGLASEFLTHDVNDRFRYNAFFIQKKDVYPWLKKEVLRWHIRREQDKNKKEIVSTNTAISSNGESTETNTCKVCLPIQ